MIHSTFILHLDIWKENCNKKIIIKYGTTGLEQLYLSEIFNFISIIFIFIFSIIGIFTKRVAQEAEIDLASMGWEMRRNRARVKVRSKQKRVSLINKTTAYNESCNGALFLFNWDKPNKEKKQSTKREALAFWKMIASNSCPVP